MQPFALGQPDRFGHVGIDTEPNRLAVHPFDLPAMDLVHPAGTGKAQLAIQNRALHISIRRPRQYHAERVFRTADHVFFKCPVGKQQLPVTAPADAHRRIQPVEHGSQPLLRRRHRQPPSPVLGNVIKAGQPALLVAGAVAQWRHVQPHVKPHAVGTLEHQLEAEWRNLAAPHPVKQVVQLGMPLLRPETVGRPLPDQAGFFHTQHVAKCPVDPPDTAVGINGDQAVFHRVFNRSPQRGFALERLLGAGTLADVLADLPQAADQQQHQQHQHGHQHRQGNAKAAAVRGGLQAQPVPGRGEFDLVRQHADPPDDIELAGDQAAPQVHHADLVLLGDPPRHMVIQHLVELVGQLHHPEEAPVVEYRRHHVDQRLAVIAGMNGAVGRCRQPAGRIEQLQRLVVAGTGIGLGHITITAGKPEDITIRIAQLNGQKFRVFTQEQTRSILEAAGIHAPAGVIGPVRGRPLLHGLEALAQRLLQPQDVLDQRVLTLVTPVFPDQLRQHDQHHHQHDQGADRQPYQIAPGLVAFPFHHIPQLTTCAL